MVKQPRFPQAGDQVVILAEIHHPDDPKKSAKGATGRILGFEPIREAEPAEHIVYHIQIKNGPCSGLTTRLNYPAHFKLGKKKSGNASKSSSKGSGNEQPEKANVSSDPKAGTPGRSEL